MRRATDRLVRPALVRPALDNLHKTVILSAMLVSAILFVGKKSQAVENNSMSIVAIKQHNSVQDTSIAELKETLKVLAYIACATTNRNDPTLPLPPECGKVIDISR